MFSFFVQLYPFLVPDSILNPFWRNSSVVLFRFGRQKGRRIHPLDSDPPLTVMTPAVLMSLKIFCLYLFIHGFLHVVTLMFRYDIIDLIFQLVSFICLPRLINQNCPKKGRGTGWPLPASWRHKVATTRKYILGNICTKRKLFESYNVSLSFLSMILCLKM